MKISKVYRQTNGQHADVDIHVHVSLKMFEPEKFDAFVD